MRKVGCAIVRFSDPNLGGRVMKLVGRAGHWILRAIGQCSKRGVSDNVHRQNGTEHLSDVPLSGRCFAMKICSPAAVFELARLTCLSSDPGSLSELRIEQRRIDNLQRVYV